MTTRSKLIVVLTFCWSLLVARAIGADAHTPAVSVSCDRLTVQLTNYERRSTVIVTIAGTRTVERFDRQYTRTFTGLGAYTVIVDNNGDGYDSEWSGMLTTCGSGATGPAPTTSTPSSGATGPAPTTTSTSTTTPKVIELIPPITAPPTTAVQVIALPPVVTTAPAQVLAAVEVPLPPTVLAHTGPDRAETLAIIGLCLLGTGGSLYVAARRRTA